MRRNRQLRAYNLLVVQAGEVSSVLNVNNKNYFQMTHNEERRAFHSNVLL